jgi:hypothetical protein
MTLHAQSALHHPARLEALRRTRLLGAPPEPALERLSRLAARLLRHGLETALAQAQRVARIGYPRRKSPYPRTTASPRAVSRASVTLATTRRRFCAAS